MEKSRIEPFFYEKHPTYRSLTAAEQARLEQNLCVAEDWSSVYVTEGFDPAYCRQVCFSGVVKIGATIKVHELDGGVRVHSGLDHCHLHNCVVGDNVFISRVHRYIANYFIDDDTRIANVDTIHVEGSTTFGNGTRVSVLNETGGREVVITDCLSAQVAYMMAFYRHDEELTERLVSLSETYAAEVRSPMGYIGVDVVIKDCSTLKNMYVGDAARITGASLLENGSLNSTPLAPVRIGHNVIAQDFICASGACIYDGCTLSNCFVGQGTHMSHLFSAHDSLFFANCQAENGEACAVFAGPYTVTMHKSSLLIAGYYSFLNAGSGSNQSNHLYKLGPIHQGIVERGSKTTSDSYILWPSHIGPFSLVMGRHVHHVDSSDFPFSYLIEDHNESYLVPAINLRSVGTIRDAKKWPNRDKRTDAVKTDCINFNLLSPYTVGKMVRGYRVLQQLSELLRNDGNQEYVYRNMRIRSKALTKGLQLYDIAITKFLGNSLIKQLEDCPCQSDAQVISWLTPKHPVGLGDWVDLSGMIAPRSEIRKITKAIKSGAFDSLAVVNARLSELHAHYYRMEWTWAYQMLLDWFGLRPDELTRAKVAELVQRWKEAVVGLDRMLYDDAKKEFTMNTQVGFGIDLYDEDKQDDFAAVRGNFESNPFVLDVLSHLRAKTALGDELLARL